MIDTTQPSRILEHLVRMALVDKQYAWWAAKNYASLNPSDCKDMPDQLKQRMLALKEKQ